MKVISSQRKTQLAHALMLMLMSSNVYAANDLTSIFDRAIGLIVYIVGFALLYFFASGVVRMGQVFGALRRLKGNPAQQQDPSAAKDLAIDFASALGLMGLTVIISYAVVSFFGTTAIINAAQFNGLNGGSANMIDLSVGQK